MRRAAWICAALLAVSSTASATLPHELIIANSGIGLFRLGMTVAVVQALRKTAPCDVVATYKDGKAIRLETNCGGAYHTAEWVQVGGAPSRAVWFYGDPDRVVNSDGFNHRADWLYYNGGISFRVIYGAYGTALIQAIAVFPGTGRILVRQGPPPEIAPPPPGVGE